MNGRPKCPVLEEIFPGQRFYYRAKIGGERQLISVTVATFPYSKDYGQGRETLYVNVYGYGWSGSVPVKKLMERKRISKVQK